MFRWAGVAALSGLLAAPSFAALKINGSTTVNPVVSEAAALLRTQGLEIQVDTVGGSSGGIAALGDGRADIAMSSRPLKQTDRERFRNVDFRATPIGADAVALVVSKDVWDAGLRCLRREQIRVLYDGTVERWSELGGPDRRVVFFNKEPGRGTWEVFADWLYGDAAAAPLVNLPEVGSNEEARNKVASTRGAVTQLSAAWADNVSTFALGLCVDGRIVPPTAEAVVAGKYPMSRPLLVITDGPPRLEAQRLIDFVLGPEGQALVRKHGYLPLEDAGPEESAP